VLDILRLNAIMDAPIVPGTVIGSVLCPSGREQEIRITIKSWRGPKSTTFGVKPDDAPCEITRQVVDDSRRLAAGTAQKARAAVKQSSFLST
jgi:hypothetical protein